MNNSCDAAEVRRHCAGERWEEMLRLVFIESGKAEVNTSFIISPDFYRLVKVDQSMCTSMQI